MWIRNPPLLWYAWIKSDCFRLCVCVFFPGYVCVFTDTLRSQKIDSYFLELSYRQLWASWPGCWKPYFGPLEDQKVILLAESPVQPGIFHYMLNVPVSQEAPFLAHDNTSLLSEVFRHQTAWQINALKYHPVHKFTLISTLKMKIWLSHNTSGTELKILSLWVDIFGTQFLNQKTKITTNLRVTKQVVHSFLKVLQVDSVHALGEVIVVIISQSQDSKALPSQQTSPILQKATSNSEKVYDPRKGSISLGKAKAEPIVLKGI